MELVYLEDAYVKELETIITSIDPALSAVQFEKALFIRVAADRKKITLPSRSGGETTI